jgi:hypothetical protein
MRSHDAAGTCAWPSASDAEWLAAEHRGSIQRQPCMAPEGHDPRLLGLRQHGGPRFRRTGFEVLDCRPLPPFRHHLGISAEFPAQLRERSLRSLYCCSDGVRGRGASVTNLSYSASFHSCERIGPSNHGIKHLSRESGKLSLWPPERSCFALFAPHLGFS